MFSQQLPIFVLTDVCDLAEALYQPKPIQDGCINSHADHRGSLFKDAHRQVASQASSLYVRSY